MNGLERKSKKSKKKTLSVNERQARHLASLKKFGIHRTVLKTSTTQTNLMYALMLELGIKSKQELLTTLIEKVGKSHGLFLKDMSKEPCQKM